MYKQLAGAPYRIAAADPEQAEASAVLAQLSAALAAISGDSGAASFDAGDVRGPASLFVLAWDASGQAVGCGGFRPLEPGVAEVKRMYAQPGTAGVGAAILAHLEAAALELGYRSLRLETRLVNARAVTFYENRGYRRIPNFGKYVGRAEAVCFEKALQ
ncbi:MAG: GNAT family N-acetyltransferase [Burkholderiales bacterium]|nr:GNAT family N-acetyltransferase [Burkholderiales bacterium]